MEINSFKPLFIQVINCEVELTNIIIRNCIFNRKGIMNIASSSAKLNNITMLNLFQIDFIDNNT